MKHNVITCPCPDCFRTRQHWAYKRWANHRARRDKYSPKYEPPEDVERVASSQAKDEVITRVEKLEPKRTELKGFLADY